MPIMKKISRLIIILFFFLAGFFLFANKIQANCGDILGTCQNDSLSCGYGYQTGYCPGGTHNRCCAPDCGQAGGNSCGVTKSGYTCTNIGRTYDCDPCYSCTQNAAPTAAPTRASPGARR